MRKEEIPLNARLSFAASGTVNGLLLTGISYFLLLYYNQVLGLDPALAGFAMMIALMADAISDPLIGRWSDRLKHRLGRRHPFLFAAILPIPLAYYLLWIPPGMSQTNLFLYMLILTVALRVSTTLHVVPFNALLPELVKDYDGRTRLMNFSFASATFLGNLFAVVMYAYWLADTPEYPDGAGILRSTGYVSAGGASAVAMFLCLIYATFATKRYIPNMAPPPPRGSSLGAALAETRTTLSDRSFLAMVVSGILGASASSTSTALWAYMQPLFWGFDSGQTSLLIATGILSAVLGFWLTPKVTEGRNKKPVLMLLFLISICLYSGPVLLSLIGFFPPKGHPALFPTMLAVSAVNQTLGMMTATLTASMIADIVEHQELATGRREEGLFFSIQSFIGKVAGGIGIWIGGAMLAIIEFPTNAAATAVDPMVIERLGWLYGPALGVFWSLSIFAVSFYRIDRHAHERNLESLGRSRRPDDLPSGPNTPARVTITEGETAL